MLPDLHTALLTSATALLLLAALLFLRSGERRRFVRMVDALPGPPLLPLLGNALDVMVDRSKLMDLINARTRKYAPIFRTWSGPDAVVHLTRAEHIEAIMGGSKHTSKARWYVYLQPWLGLGLLTSAGAKWQSRRKLITPTFHFKILDAFCDVFVEQAAILVDKMAAAAQGAGADGFDVYPLVNLCTLDIICETAMGTKIHAQQQASSQYVDAVFDISQVTLLRAVRPWLYPDFVFYRTSLGRRYKQCLAVLHGFTEKVIRERRHENLAAKTRTKEDDPEPADSPKPRRAFLDLLLAATHEGGVSEGGLVLDDASLREEVDTFMFEGHDTTTAGLAWTLFMLAHHQDIQERCVEELDAIFGGSARAPTMRDLGEMRVLERVVKETLRLYPSVPFVMRTLDEDVQLGGYTLPGGCMVNVHIFHLHRDPEHFPEPEVFDPDRFLPERSVGRHPFAYLPFSAGPRNCVGQKFALLEEKTLLCAVLRAFHLRTSQRPDDVTLVQELILRPESGIRLLVTPRQKTASS